MIARAFRSLSVTSQHAGSRWMSAAASKPRWIEFSLSGSAVHPRVELEARGHKIIVDEPVQAGGQDTGPTPLEYSLAALGSCKAITIGSVANRMKINVDSIDIPVVKGAIDGRGFGGVEGVPARFQRIELEVVLNSQQPIPKDQLEVLKATAQRCCPIADMMHAAGANMDVKVKNFDTVV